MSNSIEERLDAELLDLTEIDSEERIISTRE